MDPPYVPSTRQHRRPSTKLSKQPPSSSSSTWSIKKKSSNTSLQRHPSAPVYPRSFGSSRDHFRTKSGGFASSTSSIDQHSDHHSPIPPTSEFGAYASTHNSDSAKGHRSQQHTARSSLNVQSSDELIGARFDTHGMLSALDAASNPDAQTARRPPLLQGYNTSPDPRLTPTLRNSASFSPKGVRMEPPSPEESPAASKRYSDEGSGRPSLGGRKRTGFSNFVNSMLGSPRNIKISAPENPVHVTHVGYDNQTGQFTVC